MSTNPTAGPRIRAHSSGNRLGGVRTPARIEHEATGHDPSRCPHCNDAKAGACTGTECGRLIDMDEAEQTAAALERR